MVGYSMTGGFRWTPGYDFGDSAGTVYALAEVEIYTDPLFNVDLASTLFRVPTVGITSVIISLGVIGSETAGTLYSLPAPSMVNLLRPLGTVASEAGATTFAVATLQMLDVLRPQGTIASETESTSYRVPTVSCAP